MVTSKKNPANTHKKNKSYTVTWSDEESKERKEPFSDVMVLVSLATIEDPPTYVVANVVSSLGPNAESSDDEEISD